MSGAGSRGEYFVTKYEGIELKIEYRISGGDREEVHFHGLVGVSSTMEDCELISVKFKGQDFLQLLNEDAKEDLIKLALDNYNNAT